MSVKLVTPSNHLLLCLFLVQTFYLLRFTTRYFIIFDAVVNKIVFLISLSDSSLLVSRNNRFLYINFIFCNFTEFINWFYWFFGGTFRIFSNTMSSANSDSFTSSFQIWFLFLFLAWLLWLGLQIVCWVKVVTVGVLVLLLILEEMLSAFYYWDAVSVGLSYLVFILLRYVPYGLIFMFFFLNHIQMLNFVSTFI